MSKQPMLKETRENTAKTFQTPDLPSGDAKPDLRPVIECEKVSRVSRSRQLDVLEYQPCERDSARPLLSGWHLLFFARTGTTHIQALRTALQQESERDVQLMQCFKRVQVQYRQHAARDAQTVSESVASQPVIASIRYGGLTIVPGFWLPEDMEMGVSLIPTTGAKLPLDTLTLVEHSKHSTSQSLDVLMVVDPSPRTKAELAALQFVPGDGADLEKHVITLCDVADAAAPDAFQAAVTQAVRVAEDLVADFFVIGYIPTTRPAQEDMIKLQAERLRGLGPAASVSQLLEARRQLLVGSKTR